MQSAASRSFGAQLKALREAAGFTQEELATIAGLSVHAVSALERGQRRRPHLDTVRALAAALDLTGVARDALFESARARQDNAAVDELRDISLPLAPTLLLGRDSDVQTLRLWLADPTARLITLTGPGGAGKTRLALELARAIAAEGATRVVFVPLVAIREKAFGKEDLEYAKSLFSLAEFYRFTGKSEKAEPLYKQAAILRRKLLGRQHPDYLKTRDRFFCLAYQANDQAKLKDFMSALGDKPGDGAPDIVEGNILNGRAISLPKPYYTLEAHRQRLQGTIVVRIMIDETGKVIEAKDMCGGNPLLVKSSLASAREARFTPTLRAGQPVQVGGILTYHFVRM